MRLKLDYFVTCNIWDNILAITEIKLGMTVELYMAFIIMLMLVSMTLTLMQGGSAKATCQC